MPPLGWNKNYTEQTSWESVWLGVLRLLASPKAEEACGTLGWPGNGNGQMPNQSWQPEQLRQTIIRTFGYHPHRVVGSQLLLIRTEKWKNMVPLCHWNTSHHLPSR